MELKEISKKLNSIEGLRVYDVRLSSNLKRSGFEINDINEFLDFILENDIKNIFIENRMLPSYDKAHREEMTKYFNEKDNFKALVKMIEIAKKCGDAIEKDEFNKYIEFTILVVFKGSFVYYVKKKEEEDPKYDKVRDNIKTLIDYIKGSKKR